MPPQTPHPVRINARPTTMPQVLMVTTVSRTISTFLLPVVNHLRARGWRVEALARGVSTDSKVLSAVDDAHEINWTRQPLTSLLAGPSMWQLRRRLLNGGYDIVHVHTPIAAFITRAVSLTIPRSKRPIIIYTAHGFHFHAGARPLYRTLALLAELSVRRATDYLIVINREDFAAALRYGLIAEGRLVQFPGVGIDCAAYPLAHASDRDVARVRSEIGIGSTDQLLLMVAEFNPGKRHADVVRAFQKLSIQTVHLAFAGTGPAERAVRELATELGLTNRVHFLGFRADIPILLRAASASIVASEREGLSRAVMESFCTGTPVVGSTARGVRDLLEGERGVMFPVGDVAALTAGIEQVLADPVTTRQMTKRAAEYVKRVHAVGHVVALHEALYMRAIEGRAIDLGAR